jgi:manganese/zinc/iron transport system ATP- binding protein
MTNSIPAVEIKNLTVAYDANPVLWDVDLLIEQQVVMGLVGPNGAGKSTLLKSVLGLTPRLAGEICVMGQPFESNRKLISYVPQRSTIDWDFPTTVLDLVMMGTYGRLGWFRRPSRQEKADSMAALEKLSMQDFANRQISELSGGQQQRAFLARSFVQNAPIYFLDEPFAGVDVTTERAIVDFLHELRDQGKTIVVVQHDLSTVGKYLDQITLINQSIVASGNVSEVFNDETIDATYSSEGKVSGFGNTDLELASLLSANSKLT